MANFGELAESQLIKENIENIDLDKIQIPTLNQVLFMFEKNGFRSNNIITKDQLKQLLDRQYAMNNRESVGSSSSFFSIQLFQELWNQLSLLSDSTAKIQSISKVIYEAIVQLQKKLRLINSRQGMKHKESYLNQLFNRQRQLTAELDQIDAQFNHRQEKIKSERNLIRKNIGYIKAQIKQIKTDRQSFENQLKILIVTIGQHQAANIQTKIIFDGYLSKVGLEKKQKSTSLKLIFILTIICLLLQLFTLSYKNSFFALVGFCAIIFVLFCGYYTEKSVVYLIVYLLISALLDLVFVYLNTFTNMIQNPVTFTLNKIVKYLGMISIFASVVIRVILMIQLCSYREIPKTQQYFEFWGEQVTLNRRSKHFNPTNESNNSDLIRQSRNLL